MNLFKILIHLSIFIEFFNTQICGLIDIFPQLQKLDQSDVLNAERNFQKQLQLNQITVFGWFQFSELMKYNPIQKAVLKTENSENFTLFEITYIQDGQEGRFQLELFQNEPLILIIEQSIELMQWFQYSISIDFNLNKLIFLINVVENNKIETAENSIENKNFKIQSLSFQFGCFLQNIQDKSEEDLSNCSKGFVDKSYFMFEYYENLDLFYLITQSQPFVDSYVFNVEYQNEIKSQNTQNYLQIQKKDSMQDQDLNSNEFFNYEFQLQNNVLKTPTFFFQIFFSNTTIQQQTLLVLKANEQNSNVEQDFKINISQQNSSLIIELSIDGKSIQKFDAQVDTNQYNQLFFSFIIYNNNIQLFIKINDQQIILSQAYPNQYNNFYQAQINTGKNIKDSYFIYRFAFIENLSGIITSQFREPDNFCAKNCKTFSRDYFDDRLCISCNEEQVLIAQLSKCYEFCPKNSFQKKGVCTKCQDDNCSDIIQPKIIIQPSSVKNGFIVNTGEFDQINFNKQNPIKIIVNDQPLQDSQYQIVPIDQQNAEIILDNDIQGQVTFDLKDDILIFDENKNQIQNQQVSFYLSEAGQETQDQPDEINIDTQSLSDAISITPQNLQQQDTDNLRSNPPLTNGLFADQSQIIQNGTIQEDDIQIQNSTQPDFQSPIYDSLIIRPQEQLLDATIIMPVMPIQESSFIQYQIPQVDSLIFQGSQIPQNTQTEEILVQQQQQPERQNIVSQNTNTDQQILQQNETDILLTQNIRNTQNQIELVDQNNQTQKRDRDVENNFYNFGKFIFILFMVQFGIGLFRELYIDRNYNRSSFVFQKWLQVFLLGQYLVFFLCYNINLPYNFRKFLQGFFVVFVGTHDIFRDSITDEYEGFQNFKDAYMNQNYTNFTRNNISTTLIINFGLIIIIQAAFVLFLFILSCFVYNLKVSASERPGCCRKILNYFYDQLVYKFIITIFLLFTVEMGVFMFYNFATDILQYTNLGILQFSVFVSFLYIIITVVVALVLLLNTEKEYSTPDVEFMLRGLKIEGLSRKYLFFQYFYFIAFSFLLVVLYQSQLWQALSTFLLCFLMFLYIIIYRPPIHLFYQYEQVIFFLFLLVIHLLILLLAIDQDQDNYSSVTRWNIGYALAIISIILLLYCFIIVTVDSFREFVQYCRYKQIDREIDHVNEEVNQVQDIEGNFDVRNQNNVHLPNLPIQNIQESAQIHQPYPLDLNSDPVPQKQIEDNLLSQERNLEDTVKLRRQIELKKTLEDLKKRMLETEKRIEMKKRLKDQIKVKRYDQNSRLQDNFKNVQKLKDQKKEELDIQEISQILQQKQEHQHDEEGETLLQINQELIDLAEDILNDSQKN